jgi:hypothetical protein
LYFLKGLLFLLPVSKQASKHEWRKTQDVRWPSIYCMLLSSQSQLDGCCNF